MKDNTIKHISELDGSLELEIISNEDNTITLSINTHLFYEPSKQITFTKEGIVDLIHDLNQCLK